MKKLFTIALMVLICLVLFSGCANNSGSSGRTVELNMITCFPEAATDTSALAFYKVWDAFVENNPDIKINHETVDPATYPFKMQTLAMADDLPDVFLLEGSATKTFFDQSVIKPINDVLDNDPEWKNLFLDGVFDDIKLGNDIFAVPFQMTPCTLLFYNEKLLNEVGVNEPPKDWPAFMDAIAKLRDAGKIPIALGNKEQWVAVSPMFSTIADRVTGTDFTFDVNAGKAKFTDPIFIDALNIMADLRDAGAFNDDMNTIDPEQGRVLFAQGNSGFMFEGGWAISSVDMALDPDLAPYIKIMDTPTIPGGKGTGMSFAGGGGFGWTFNYKLSDEGKEAAVRTIKHFTTGDYLKYLCELGGTPPAKVSDVDESSFTPLMISANEYIAQSRFLPVYDVNFPAQIYTLFYIGIQEILTGTSTPEEVAEMVQAEMDIYLAS